MRKGTELSISFTEVRKKFFFFVTRVEIFIFQVGNENNCGEHPWLSLLNCVLISDPICITNLGKVSS